MTVSEFMKKMMIAREINFEEGRFEMMGIRGVILPAYTVATFIEHVYEELGDDVFDMLFETGKQHGKLGIKKMGEEHSMKRKEFFDQTTASANVMAVGKQTLEQFNHDKGTLTVKIEDSPFANQFQESPVLQDVDRPVDQLQRGIWHAMAEEVFQRPVKSKETTCEFLGDTACTIKIQPE